MRVLLLFLFALFSFSPAAAATLSNVQAEARDASFHISATVAGFEPFNAIGGWGVVLALDSRSTTGSYAWKVRIDDANQCFGTPAFLGVYDDRGRRMGSADLVLIPGSRIEIDVPWSLVGGERPNFAVGYFFARYDWGGLPGSGPICIQGGWQQIFRGTVSTASSLRAPRGWRD